MAFPVKYKLEINSKTLPLQTYVYMNVSLRFDVQNSFSKPVQAF